MNTAELIRKKRRGLAHSRAEIRFLIQGYATEKIPDYQMSAWLMAICFQSMNEAETAYLTEEMRDSGVVLDLSAFGKTVDKHSTGGVGDKVSLILAPLVAAAGVPVPMMAGRGLGHTGGTLDKLEAISGFNVSLSFEQFRAQVASLGVAIMGQTKEICPADRKLYALRDVTGTVDSLPLICGSIMSKKLAEGMSALVLDVKFGSGAFMKTEADAEALARALKDIGERCGKAVSALITRMDEPLGRMVGNALEVRECLDIMDGQEFSGDGKSWDDLVDLTLQLAAHMIYLGGKASDLGSAYSLATKLLKDGSAKRKFVEICRAQGGDLSKPLPEAPLKVDILAAESGYMKYVDVEKIGAAAIELGAGRRMSTDLVDPAVGIEVFRSQGESIEGGARLFTLFAREPSTLIEAEARLRESYEISSEPAKPSPLIAKVIQ